jgi:alkylation response protein AidB-like acyl-CoA dehydrogenase
MPIGLAGAIACGPEAAPPEHRAAWGAQIARLADEYRRGFLFAACNSEKGAGGSLAATRTIATRGDDGRYRLTGEKILASFGTNAHLFFSTAKVSGADMPGAGIVEFFLVEPSAPGVNVMHDWNGFGMRGTESHTVKYEQAIAREPFGFPGFIDAVRPQQDWFCLFAAIPLGCAAALLRGLGTPTPTSPALRARLSDALMRYEAARAYLKDAADGWRTGADAAYGARVLRAKTYVSQEATRLCAELFALSGGRHYVRGSALASALADSFAGTALRPPLPLALDTLIEQFSLEGADVGA